SFGFMEIYNYRPIGLKRDYIKNAANAVLMQTRGAFGHPKSRRFGIAETAPAPALFGPVFFFAITAVIYELKVLSIGDQGLTGFKSSNTEFSAAILIVPTKSGKVFGLTDMGNAFFKRGKAPICRSRGG